MENEKLEKKKQRDKLIDSVMGSLEEAFKPDSDEADEIEEIGEIFETDDTDTAESGSEPKKINRIFVTLAAFMIIFSIIGIITAVDRTGKFIDDIADRRVLKEELALFVLPVVINDPPPFDSVGSLQHSTIISCAIWKIIFFGDTANYETDMGVMYVSAVAVESSAHSIFGFGALNHTSVSNLGIEFIYDEENNNYQIPENPLFNSYSPVVSEVTNVGELYTVTVEYMMLSPLAIAGIDYDNIPIKTMTYTISRTRERSAILSIQFAEQAHNINTGL